MNRMPEWEAYKNEIETIPLPPARPLKRRRYTGRGVLGAAALLAASFVILVNTSVAFARMVGELPPLRALAELVTNNPSILAAIENQYVQPIGQVRTEQGVSVQLHYAIADREQLSVFFSISGTQGHRYATAKAWLEDVQGEQLEAASSWGRPADGVELEEIRFYTSEGVQLPANPVVVMEVSDSDPADAPGDTGGAVQWRFALTLDESLMGASTTYPLERWVDIGGQQYYLEGLRISPLTAKLNLHPHPDNTARLTDLGIVLVDEHQATYPNIRNGVTGFMADNGLDIAQVSLESSYFAKADSLSLHIEQAALIPDDQRLMWVDAQAGTIAGLPSGVTLREMRHTGRWLSFTFLVEKLPGQAIYNPFGGYVTADGQEHYIERVSTMTHPTVSGLNEAEAERYFQVEFTVQGAQDGPLALQWRSAPLAPVEPIVIPLF